MLLGTKLPCVAPALKPAGAGVEVEPAGIVPTGTGAIVEPVGAEVVDGVKVETDPGTVDALVVATITVYAQSRVKTDWP